MKCAEIRKLYSAYLDSELESPTEERFRRHLGECRECKKDFELFKQQCGEMESGFKAIAKSVASPVSLSEAVKERISAEAAAPKSSLQSLLLRTELLVDAVSIKQFSPAARIGWVSSVVIIAFLAIFTLASSMTREPKLSMVRTQSKNFVSFKVSLKEDGRIEARNATRDYVLLLNIRERWLR